MTVHTEDAEFKDTFELPFEVRQEGPYEVHSLHVDTHSVTCLSIRVLLGCLLSMLVMA